MLEGTLLICSKGRKLMGRLVDPSGQGKTEGWVDSIARKGDWRPPYRIIFRADKHDKGTGIMCHVWAILTSAWIGMLGV
jgi:hypothetical protein